MEVDLSQQVRMSSMTCGDDVVTLRKATNADLDAIKRLADQHKRELGFIVRSAMSRSIETGEVIIAVSGEQRLCGFVQFRHRKDEQTTLYNIVVDPSVKNQGVGRLMIQELAADAIKNQKQVILLRCPVDLPANDFYRRCGFMLDRVEKGKSRPLNIWLKRL